MNTKTVRLAARVGFDVVHARLRPGAARNPVLLNALPKSGTHLLISAVERLPDVSRVRLQISRMNADVLGARPGEDMVPGGVAAPTRLSAHRVHRWLAAVPAGAFATAHMPWSEGFAGIIDDLGMQMILMFRDPRDVAVSAGAYIAKQTTHPMHRHFESLSEAERIAAAITGVAPGSGYPGLEAVRSRVATMMPWLDHPRTLLVRFEDLVGASGGGTEERQRLALEAIAQHVGSAASEEQLRDIGRGLFGGTATFRSGQIGGWRTTFTDEHRRLAADALDDLVARLGYAPTGAARQE